MPAEHKYKACPSCGKSAGLHDATCAGCGRVFRTRFTDAGEPITATTTAAAPPSPPPPAAAPVFAPPDAPPAYTRYTRSERVRVKLPPEQSGAGCQIVLGVVLILTAYGAIFGLPLLIAGLWQQYFAKHEVRLGECPYCGSQINVQAECTAATCYACRKQVIVRGDLFYAL